MFTTATIAFREFFEAFLLIGVFLGISSKLQLKKEKEIGLAAFLGLLLAFLLTLVTYIFADHARNILTEKNADFLESYLLIFSGLFIAYVVFSLHNILNRGRGIKLLKAHQKLQKRTFDISLFLTIVLLIVREGFEVALFTASASLFSGFIQNVFGLLFGFVLASALGLATCLTYVKLQINKLFRFTEYAIILLGASLVQNGITKLLQINFNISLANIASLHLQFLPREDTFIGNLLQAFLGLDQNFSFARLSIMLVYISIIHFMFIRQRNIEANTNHA